MALNVWQRLTSEIRSYWTGPLTSRSPELARLWTGAETYTGVPVSEYTALNYSAFWTAVSLIASDVASLPLILYKREKGGGKSRYTDSKLYRLLHDEPNPEMSSVVFRETLQAHALTWGNGYAEIERDGSSKPVALWPITPNRVIPFRGLDRVLRYTVTADNGGPETVIDRADMFHVPGLGFDGLVGYSVIAKARESIGLGIATERFGATFFGNGATFGGVVEHPGRMSEQAQKNFRETVASRHQGVNRAHQLLLLEEGSKYQKIGIPPNEAQFIESRKFQIEEIARWFRLPPHKIGSMDRATFSNIEHQTLDYVRSCLRGWLVRWEQEINRKLISPSERNIQFAEHNLEGLLRGDSTARAEFYRTMFNIGVFSVNMVLERENENGIGTDGDVHMVPMNMVPLDRLGEIVDAQIAVKATPTPTPPATTPATGTNDPEGNPTRQVVDALITAHAAAIARAEEHLRRAVTADMTVAQSAEEKTRLLVERNDSQRDFQRAQSEADALKAQIVLTEQQIERERTESTALAAEALGTVQREADQRLAESVAAEDRSSVALTEAQALADQRAAERDEALRRADTIDAERLALLAEKDALTAAGEARVAELATEAATLRQDVTDTEMALRQAHDEVEATREREAATAALLAAAQSERDRIHAESEARAAEWSAQLAQIAAEAKAHEGLVVRVRGEAVTAREEADAALAALTQAQTESMATLAECAVRETDMADRIAAMQDVSEALRTAAREKEEAAAKALDDLTHLRSAAESTEAELAAAKAAQEASVVLVAEQQARAVELDRQITELRAETQAKEEAAAEALADLMNLRASAASTETEMEAVCAAKDLALTRFAESQARSVELERQIAETKAEATLVADAATQAEADALAAVAKAEQRSAQTVQEQADAFIVEQRNKEADRLASMLTAHRAIAVDAVSRVLRRESERARSKQATPQKLRAWAETFYPMHDATVIDALLPVVRAHLAWMQSTDDPELVVRTYARAFVDDSRRQIMAVVDSDPDDLTAALERVLQHWEAKRADAFADRLMEEGIAYVRSYR